MTDTKEKWTKGAWEAEERINVFPSCGVIVKNPNLPKDRTYGYGCEYGYGCGNDFICDLNDGEYHEYTNPEEQQANAYLIAAAPDMYAALKSAIEVLQAHCAAYCHKLNEDCGLKNACIWGHVCNQVKDAMGKALGESYD